MKVCPYCHSYNLDTDLKCSTCGLDISNVQPTNFNTTAKQSNPDDSGAIGWGFLGFFIPIAGLILFIVWRNDKPKSSKAAGIGVLISFIINVIASFLYAFMVYLLPVFGVTIGLFFF